MLSSMLRVAACLAVTVLLPARALAQVPILDGHRFVPSSLVSWSFVDTEVSSTSEAGITDFVVDPVVLQLPTQFDGRFATVSQNVSASYAFDDIVSLNVQLTGAGIVPLGKVSAIVVGGTGIISEGGGVAVRLLRAGPLQLTLRGDVIDSQVESVVPLRILSGPRITGDVLDVRPALAAALTVIERVGLQASATVDWERFDVDARDDIVGFAGALAATVSLELVPLTVLVGANVRHEFGRDLFSPTTEAVFGPTRTDGNVEAGLYFTGRSELDLGLLFRGEVGAGDHNNVLHGLFRLGYYF